MDYGNVAYHDYAQYLLTPDEYQTIFMLENKDRVTNSEFAGDIVEFWLGIFELASIFQSTLFKDWKYIDECRHGIELSFLTFYAASRRNINDNTKRNKSPRSYPSVDERSEMVKMRVKYSKPEFITRMKPIEAPPPKGEKTQEEDERMNEGGQPSASTPGEQETQPASSEVDPMAYKEGEGRSVSPTATWTNPGLFSTKEIEPSSSPWKRTHDNIQSVKKRAQEMNICLCCASDARSLTNFDNENFVKNKGDIMACFEHIEKILKVNFTERDEVVIKRDQAEREKKRAKTANGDDEDVEMEDIDLPEETAQLGEESLTPPTKEPPSSKSSSSKDDYEKAVASMKRSFDNATIITRFHGPVDICSIVDEMEGGEFKVINRRIGVSGPPDTRSLEETLTRAQSAGSKLPKVTGFKDDSRQVHKQAYRQIWVACNRVMKAEPEGTPSHLSWTKATQEDG